MRASAVLLAFALLGGQVLAAEASLEARVGPGAAVEARVDGVPLGPFTIGAGLGWGRTGWVSLRAGMDHSLGPAGLLASTVEGVAGLDLSLWGMAQVRATLGPLDAGLRGHLATRPLAQITGPLAGRPAGSDALALATGSIRIDGAWRLDRQFVVEGALEGQERDGVLTLAADLGVSLPNLVERGVTVGFSFGLGGPGGAWSGVVRVTDRSGPTATQLVVGFGEQVRDPFTGAWLPPRVAPGFLVAHTVPLGDGPALPGMPGAVAEMTLAWLPWTVDRPLVARLEVRATPVTGLRVRVAFEADAVSASGRISGSLVF